MRLLTTEDIKRDIEILGKGKFKLLSEYEKDSITIDILHKTCGSISNIRASDFKRKKNFKYCAYCMPNRKYTHDDFLDRVYELMGNDYTVLGEYEKSSIPIKVRHNECNTEFEVRPHLFIGQRKQRCPECTLEESKGVEEIKSWLESNEIEYIQEYTFRDCKDERVLPFDFYVEYDNKFVLIEYDGEQHFRKKFKMTDKDLEDRKYKDSIKDKYCKENNIDLLRISFKDKPKPHLEDFFESLK